MSAKPDPNYWHIIVTPRIGSQYTSIKPNLSDNDAVSLQKEIMESIKRHVDSIEDLEVVYDSFICSECESSYSDEETAGGCCPNISNT
jgi:hypothetical protein